MDDSYEFAAPAPHTVDVTYTHPAGEVTITLDPVHSDHDNTVDEWVVTVIRSTSGHPLTATLLRAIPLASIAAQVLADHPYVGGLPESPIPSATNGTMSSSDKVQAAASAWHEARTNGWKVLPHVRRALGGLSEARATHYIRQARAAGLVPEEGRRGPKPRSAAQ